MKNRIFLLGLAIIMAVSCAKDQQEVIQMLTNDPVFHASIEGNADPETRVYADDSLRVLWNANDHVSIFNKTTYNREYAFQGKDGDNSGTFKKVPSEDFVTSNPLNYVYSVYPYNENTSITNDGELTVSLPAEQIYREDSFGLGANTMIAIAEEDELMFKNLCGYFAVKLYGDNVSVSSITLKGNNNELLAGKATVVAQMDSAPTLQFDAANATKELTMTCETPVKLGTTAETATTFWFVIPPIVFDRGITIKVKDATGLVFTKETSSQLTIERNKLKKSAALQTQLEAPAESILFMDPTVKQACVEKYDSDNDGEISYTEAAAVMSISGLFDNYRYITSFDEFRYFTSVTSIPAKCFARMSILTSIVLPESIRSIGNYAFTECSSLKSFHVPTNVSSIGYRAFAKCYNLESFTFAKDSKLSTLSGWTYYDIDGNSTDYSGVFGHCRSLTTITIPASVSSIGYRLFYDCTSLKEVYFEEGSVLSTISGYDWNDVGGPFYGCTALEKVVLPETVKTIGYGAFRNCSALKEINLPESLTQIYQQAFYNCSSLPGSFTFPALKSIGSSAFYNCKSVESITLSDNCTTIGSSAFSGCTSLKSITLSKAQAIIESSTFYGCSSLEIIELPQYLSNIGSNAFSNCTKLTTISIPNNVSEIGSYAFYRCTGLNRIVILKDNPPIGNAGMFNETNNCPIAVPSASVNAFKTASIWSNYADRIVSSDGESALN